jgi:Zn-dependent protease
MLDTLIHNPLVFLISAVALLVAITIHEFAHAYAADRLGDPTPRLMGRLTLNPLAHLDPLGTILMVFIGFGWGKPVMFDPYNLKNPRRDAAIIALAGPFSNLLLASVISVILRVWATPTSSLSMYSPILYPFLNFNVVLAVFNLIPIHPLDGGKILVGLLPPDIGHTVDIFMSRYGLMLLLVLIFPVFGGVSVITGIISPIIHTLMGIYLPSAQFI